MIKYLFFGVLFFASHGFAQANTSSQVALQSNGKMLMASASRLIDASEKLKQEAKQTISQSHQLRKRIQKNQQQGIPNKVLKQRIADSKMLQQLGSRLRQQAQKLSEEALLLLRQGLIIEQQHWIQHTTPFRLNMGANTIRKSVGAHNTVARSAHPKMEKLIALPTLQQADDMSMTLASPPPQKMPDNIDLGTFQLSRNKTYFAHIEAETEHKPSSAHLVQLNTMHTWRLILTTRLGEPVQNAEITFNGTMPGHVHGLPTQPRVTKEKAPGVYEISGVKFQMRGWWVIDLTVEANTTYSQKPDTLRFNLHL